MTVPELRALLRHLVELRRWDEEEILARCHWRMQRHRVAKPCHERRGRAELRQRS